MKKAESYKPKILKKKVFPVKTVEFKENSEFYQDTQVVDIPKKEYYERKDKICLDFGRHITGYFEFSLGQYDIYIDAPVRLKIKFGETPYEMRRDFSTYKEGLCSSWLQEEIINVDTKGVVKLPRRYSFRYVEISVIASPKPIMLDNFVAISCTSADYSKLEDFNITEKLKKIDKISVDTLSECMQEVFEDGPKRDRRLWIGDFRLEALANYYTFKNLDIVKYCLYLFASFENEEKLLPSYLYIKPQLETGDAYLVTYALLYTVTLCDYFEHTKDVEVAEDLFYVAKKQIDLTKKMLDENKIIQMPKDYGWWSFVDWAKIRPMTATMGIYIYTINAFSKFCEALGKAEEAKKYRLFSEELKEASLKHLYNGEVFVNDYDENEYSVHSQIWMILSDVVSLEDSKRILKECLNNEKYIAPATPYMHHYVVDALLKVGMYDDAKKYILDYWGEMVNLGADTFWEAFVKDAPYFSPYDDAVMNSACHAWSCTPTYFIRKYKELQN